MIMNKITHEHIFDFNGEYKLAKYPPKENGYYMTIRCGLNGIYTYFDEWKNNMWQLGVLDDSSVIAYSKEQITLEQVKEWYNELKEEYNNKK